MKIKEYIQSKQSIKPNQDIKQRWESRIVARELHLQGVDGAEQYLTSYGKGISAAKVVMLARQAEDMGCLQMASAFWSLAYRLEVGTPIDPADWSDYFGADFTVTARPDKSVEIINDPNFPLNFQPGRLSPMQPEDARHEADFYINSPDYWGHPKRDGEKLIIFATKETVVYQSRSMKPAGAPSILFNQAILTVQWANGLSPAQKHKLLEAQYKTSTENQELLYQVTHHLIAGITNVNYLDACVELVEELLINAGYPEMAEALHSGEAASAVGLFDGEVDNEE